jgi:hypothetical protein
MRRGSSRGLRSWIGFEEGREEAYELLYQELEDVVEGCSCQIQQMDYSRHPEQSAALQILPHCHSVEVVLLVGHCSECMESSRGTCVDQEDGCLPVLAGPGLAVERLAAAKARGWRYWAAGLGIRVGGRGLSGGRLFARYPVESTTSHRLDREVSGCVDVSNGVGVR